ncbi:micronuclear linker histone polyprotein-like, partial [Cherax quadricarinatus]
MTISPRKRTMVGRLKSPSKGRKRNSSDEWRPASNFSFSESSIGSRRFISTRTSAAATAARLKSKEGENQKRRQSIMMKRLDLSVSRISTSPASSVRKTRRQSMAPLASMKGRVQKNLEKTKLLMSAAEKSSPVNTLKPKLPLRKSLSTRHAASVPDMTKKDAVRDVSEVKLIKQTSVRSPVRQGYYTRYRSLRSSGSLHSEGNKKRKVELDVIDEFQLQPSSKRRRLGSSPSKKREVSLISSSSKHIQAKDTTLSSKLEKKESIQSLKFEKIDPIPLSKHKEKDETQSPILKRKIDSDKSHEVWRNKDAIKLPKRTKKNYEIQSPRHTAAHVARKSSELAKCVTQLPKLASANDTMQSPQTRTSTVIQSSKTTRASAVIQSSKTTRASAVIQSSKTTTASAVIQSSKTTRASAIIQSPKLNKSSDVIQSS